MLARRAASVSRMPCRSARRDCVRWSALACSALSSAKCASSAALTAAELSAAREPLAWSASRSFSSSSCTTGCGSSARAAFARQSHRCGRRSCRSAGRRLRGRPGGRSHREVGERPRRRLVQRPHGRRARRACLQLGLERAQQRLDRIEINRRRGRVESRAKLVENRVEPPRADLAGRRGGRACR